MKKKAITTVLISIFVASMVACGGRPSGMSETTYNLGNNAYEIMDDYLSGNLVSSEDCAEQLETIHDRLDERAESLSDTDDADEYRDYSNCVRLSMDITLFIYNMSYGSESDMQENFESVAESLGK